MVSAPPGDSKPRLQPRPVPRAALPAAALWTGACLLLFALGTRHWTLISDAVLMHYVLVLMHHGMAPYRDIADVNLPGAWFVTAAANHVFGHTAFGWRLFDFALGAVAVASMVLIARPQARLGGFLAGTLFVLLHGADGVAHAGERDVVMAVLLLAGSACLFVAQRLRQPGAIPALGLYGACGFCCGLATAIKPQAALAALAILATIAAIGGMRSSFSPRLLAAWVLGATVPLAACLIFLEREHALGALLTTTRRLVLLHASLGRHTLAFLVTHAIPTLLLPIVAAAGLAARRDPAWNRCEQSALAAGASAGFASFLLQGKAYSYHRSTLVAFLLCWALVQLVHSARVASTWTRAVAAAALMYAVLWVAPAATVRALRWDTREPTLSALRADLSGLQERNPGLLHGGIQCLDTTAGCITVLDRMGATQTTGLLYDCYLFAPGGSAVVEEQRALFRTVLARQLPEVLVVTDQYCFGLPSSYRKLEQWPALNNLLANRYRLVVERPAAEEARRALATWPFGYRIYVRR